MAEHKLWITRYNRGRDAIAGPRGSRFGTTGRCSCGARYRINEPPSGKGTKEVERWFAKHLDEVGGDAS